MLYYKQYGTCSGPLIVFLHGFLGSHKDFDPILQGPLLEYDCIAIDLPGHGLSPYTPLILETITKTITSFNKPPILIGYSLGGRIALLIAKQVKAISAFILSAHIGLNTEKEKQERALADALWAHRLRTLPCKDFLSLWYSQPPFVSLQKKGKDLDSLIAKRSYTNKEERALVLEQMSLSNFVKAPLPSFPSLFLFGEDDLVYKNLYTSSIPKEQLQEISKAGHALLEENSAEVYKHILTFLHARSCCDADLF